MLLLKQGWGRDLAEKDLLSSPWQLSKKSDVARHECAPKIPARGLGFRAWVHAHNPGSREAETGGSRVPSHSSLIGKLQDSKDFVLKVRSRSRKTLSERG